MTFSIEKYRGPDHRVHMVGIGGISMSALAKMLSSLGICVTGSDRDDSETLSQLSSLGIKTFVGHDEKNVKSACAVIRTAAVSDENPEIRYARDHGIPVFERAEVWGHIMRTYPRSLCISGTHGKTTSTSMSAHIAMCAGLDPTVMVGAKLPFIGGSLKIGDGSLFIAESCEYHNSFLFFSPTIAVILNIDLDHLDFFHGIDEIIASFRSFASLTPEDGVVIANYDDANVRRAVDGIDRKIIFFGLDKNADIYAKNITDRCGFFSFDVMYNGAFLTRVSLSVPGRHNIYNALSCIASAMQLGIPKEAVSNAVSSFSGASRRFEKKGTFNGAVIVDDYAHHPSEIRATLTSACDMGFSRVICVFQPHTYTRTAALMDEFASALSLSDITIVTDIYAAREKNTVGVSSRDLTAKINGGIYISEIDGVCEYLRENARSGDIVITMGAGNIYQAADKLIREN